MSIKPRNSRRAQDFGWERSNFKGEFDGMEDGQGSEIEGIRALNAGVFVDVFENRALVCCYPCQYRLAPFGGRNVITVRCIKDPQPEVGDAIAPSTKVSSAGSANTHLTDWFAESTLSNYIRGSRV